MTAVPAPPVLFEVTDGIALIRLNRPAVRNAIDDAMQELLLARLEQARTDPEIRAVVLTGEGKAFCSGGDINGMRLRLASPPDQVAATGLRRLHRTQRLASAVHELDKVTIAAVNGSAYGIGMDLALGCDFIVASDAAAFAMSFIKVGLVSDGGGLYHLPRRVGLSMAKQLAYSGRMVGAQEAVGLGIADRLVPADDLVATALAWAAELTEGSATSIALSKAILDQTFDISLDEVLTRSAQAQAICYTTEAHRRLVTSFLDRPKSKPAGKDRSTR